MGIKSIYYRESMGWLRTIYRQVRKWFRAFYLNLFGLVIWLCLNIIRPFRLVKLCPLHSKFSHMAADTDIFLRSASPGFYLGIIEEVNNSQLLKMYRRKLPIIKSRFLYDVSRCHLLKRSVFYESLPYHDAGKYYQVKNTEPMLCFTQAEEEEGERLLHGMGIDSWFVCFHARDSAYLSEKWEKRYQWNQPYRPSEEYYRRIQDSDINNYLEAARYITSLGGYAVRMGYKVKEKLADINNPKIIDYASYHRTDFGDIYLPAKCKFFLGGNSGIWAIPTIFTTPVACPNFVRFSIMTFWSGTLFIPKKIWSVREKRFLTFREILQSEVADYFRDTQYEEAGLELVENTPEEILALAREMNERLDGFTEENELQDRYLSLLPRHFQSYGNLARMGTEFLRQNRELL